MWIDFAARHPAGVDMVLAMSSNDAMVSVLTRISTDMQRAVLAVESWSSPKARFPGSS